MLHTGKSFASPIILLVY